MNISLANQSGADACTPDKNSVPAGPVTFSIKNESAAGITEVELIKDQRILGEKENLAPGLDPVTFTLTLDGGTYQLYCPGAGTDHVDFTVTGAAAAAPTGSAQSILAQGTKDYAAYVVTQVDQMNTAVAELNTAVQAGDVDAAKSGLRQGPPVLRARRVRHRGFRAPRLPARGQRGQPRLPDRHARVDPGRRRGRLVGLPRRRARPVAGRGDHRRDQEVQLRPGHQRRQAAGCRRRPWSTAPKTSPTVRRA